MSSHGRSDETQVPERNPWLMTPANPTLTGLNRGRSGIQPLRGSPKLGLTPCGSQRYSDASHKQHGLLSLHLLGLKELAGTTGRVVARESGRGQDQQGRMNIETERGMKLYGPSKTLDIDNIDQNH